MDQSFDLVVIGTGAAGGTVAHTLRSKGWTVAIVDKRPFGGTCALRGCDPKKVLVGVAEAADWARRAHVFGPHADDVINLFALAMRAGMTATEVRSVLYAYPSASGDISYMV